MEYIDGDLFTLLQWYFTASEIAAFFTYREATYFRGYKISSQDCWKIALNRMFHEYIFDNEQVVSSRTRRSYNFADKHFWGCSYVCVVILYLHVHVCLVFVCSGAEEWLQSEKQSLNKSIINQSWINQKSAKSSKFCILESNLPYGIPSTNYTVNPHSMIYS